MSKNLAFEDPSSEKLHDVTDISGGHEYQEGQSVVGGIRGISRLGALEGLKASGALVKNGKGGSGKGISL